MKLLSTQAQMWHFRDYWGFGSIAPERGLNAGAVRVTSDSSPGSEMEDGK